METESGAKIAIRGKGSVKEGKGRSDAAHTSNQEEDLHCLIMADTEEKVNKAKKLIHNVIETVSLFPSYTLMLTSLGCLHSRRTERTQTQSTP
jgi:splicing factor 1